MITELTKGWLFVRLLLFYVFFIVVWNYLFIFAPLYSRRTTSQEVGAATGREHYILECVADALFLAIRNYHKRI